MDLGTNTFQTPKFGFAVLVEQRLGGKIVSFALLLCTKGMPVFSEKLPALVKNVYPPVCVKKLLDEEVLFSTCAILIVFWET